MGARPQCQPHQGQLAILNSQCPYQTQAPLPCTLNESGDLRLRYFVEADVWRRQHLLDVDAGEFLQGKSVGGGRALCRVPKDIRILRGWWDRSPLVNTKLVANLLI